MQQSLIEKAWRLPEPESYFRGLEPPEGVPPLPENLLLYWHDCPHERTIISTRYMLILPARPIEYIVSGNQIELDADRALLVKPYLQRSVPESRDRYDRLIVSFEAPEEACYLPGETVMKTSPESQAAAERLVDAYLDGDMLRAIFELVLLLRELSRHPVRREIPPLSTPIRLALNRINQSLELPLSIKELAAESKLSTSHFRRRFRDELGITPGDYLAERRIKRYTRSRVTAHQRPPADCWKRPTTRSEKSRKPAATTRSTRSAVSSGNARGAPPRNGGNPVSVHKKRGTTVSRPPPEKPRKSYPIHPNNRLRFPRSFS